MIRRERPFILLAQEQRIPPNAAISPAAAGAMLAELSRLEPLPGQLARRLAAGAGGLSREESILIQVDSILPLAAKRPGPARRAFLRSLRSDSAYQLVSKLAVAGSADLVGIGLQSSERMSKVELSPVIGLNGLDHAHALTYGVAASYLAEGRSVEALSVLRQLLSVDLLIIDASVYDGEVLLAARHLERTLRALAFVSGQAGAHADAARLQARLEQADHAREKITPAWSASHRPTLGNVEMLLDEPGAPRSIGWHLVLVRGPFAPCTSEQVRSRARQIEALRKRLVRTPAEHALFSYATDLRVRHFMHACAR